MNHKLFFLFNQVGPQEKKKKQTEKDLQVKHTVFVLCLSRPVELLGNYYTALDNLLFIQFYL